MSENNTREKIMMNQMEIVFMFLKLTEMWLYYLKSRELLDHVWNGLPSPKTKLTKMNCDSGIDALEFQTLLFQILILFTIPSRGLLQKT